MYQKGGSNAHCRKQQHQETKTNQYLLGVVAKHGQVGARVAARGHLALVRKGADRPVVAVALGAGDDLGFVLFFLVWGVGGGGQVGLECDRGGPKKS